MTPLRKHGFFSAIVAVAVVLAWLGASNHCALAAAANAGKAEHPCCHEPGKNQPEAPNATQCCEAFHVPLPEHVAAPAADLHELAPAWVAADPCELAPVRWQPCPAGHANAPPGSSAFYRTILTRCAPAHAPPHLAV